MGDNQDMEKEILENREKKENISEELDIDVISPNLDTKMSSFSRKFDNLKVKYRKNPKIFIAMIICLVFAGFSLIGSSYALLTYVAQTGKVTTISAGTLALDFYNESDAITLNDALPQQDNDALSKNSEYTFTLKNNGSLNANYVVSLNNTCSTSKSYTINGSSVTPTKCIPDQYIKVGIKEENGDYKVLSKGDNSFVILSGSIGANSSKTYKMKIWLDYSTPNEYNSVNNQTIVYSGKLGLEYEQGKKTLDRSGANAPELTDNMIPVYYDNDLNQWRKASTDNEKTTVTYTLGDVNSDGRILTIDSVLISRYVNGLSMPFPVSQWFSYIADVNKDGKVTQEDADLVRAYAVNSNTDYPIGEKQTVTVDTSWYNYGEKKWANAVTTTATNRDTYLKGDVGTIIPMDDINTMWVWIPRYTYTYLNTNTPEEMKIKFESGTNSSGTISCSDTATGTSSTSEECTDTTNGSLKAGTSSYTHPAFWWDKDDDSVRETGEELTGIWVGKFEIGTGQIIKPNVESSRGQYLSMFYERIYNMRESENNFGFKTTDETHMMKNMEWGAVAYLSHSKYGRCTDGTCTEVTINNCNSYITGIGADAVGASSSSTSCTTDANKYNGEKGVLASTTGNIYGIYDMSGGAAEYLMGNLVDSSGEMQASNSGFTQVTVNYPNKRYYDKYSYGTSETEYTRGKLGDATKEMAPTGTNGNWYSDWARFPYSGPSWFSRGGSYSVGSNAGLFNFSGTFGKMGEGYSTRAVISNLS